ncbi:MAG: FtsQ-type POTRA domain-containing protein [Rhodospirillaceae bacterium]|nr:FtsQ-type POTRA domain-containing protein [Rhodospirillaceae bacterium]
MILSGVIGGPAWLWHSGWVTRTVAQIDRALMAQSVRLGLTVEDVSLEGRRFARRSDIVKALGVKRGDAILGFDLASMRQRLVDLPWIRDARVERHLPDRLRVEIKERKPMALWQRKGKLVLVDDYGVIITDRKLNRFRNLIIVVGKDAPRHAPTLFAMLAAEPTLAKRVTAAVRVGARRWNLKLRRGIRIQLPESDPHRAWRRLAELNAKHRLLARDIKSIDMRLPDRLIVKPGALGAQSRQKKGRNT